MSGFYDPDGLRICLGQTTYSRTHEWTHMGQHARNSLVWRTWYRCRYTPWIGPVALLAVETDAMARSLLELRACRALETGDILEALRDYATYIRALTWL